MAFSSLQQTLNSLQTEPGWQSQRQFQRVLALWPEIVGALVAAQTHPVAIQRDILHVAASNPVWAQNLAFERQRILEKLNDRLAGSTLTEIRFSTTFWQRKKPGAGDRTVPDPVWMSHPSRVAKSMPLPRSGPEPARKTSETPHQIFLRWSERMQAQLRQLPLCPACHSPTPEGELKRWTVCAICASHRWAEHR